MTLEKREGEIELPFDPKLTADDAAVVFIGRVRSAWTSREHCPKNMGAARETGQPASVEIDEVYRPGLANLDHISHVIILTWLDRAPRNLIVQKPHHAPAARGTFSLRSPARPNPIGVHVTRLVGLDAAAGVLRLEAIDVLDGTPVVDVKPYYPRADAIPDAIVERR